MALGGIVIIGFFRHIRYSSRVALANHCFGETNRFIFPLP
jgi:hypothetical protein